MPTARTSRASRGLGLLTTATIIPARKPDPGWFVRVRPGGEWQTTTTTVDVWGRGLHFVDADLAAGLPGAEFTQLFTTINHQGGVFLWPVSVTALLGRPGRRNSASTAQAHCDKAVGDHDVARDVVARNNLTGITYANEDMRRLAGIESASIDVAVNDSATARKKYPSTSAACVVSFTNSSSH